MLACLGMPRQDAPKRDVEEGVRGGGFEAPGEAVRLDLEASAEDLHRDSTVSQTHLARFGVVFVTVPHKAGMKQGFACLSETGLQVCSTSSVPVPGLFTTKT